MEVREAKNGDELHRGLALVAPADLQCRVVRIGGHQNLLGQVADEDLLALLHVRLADKVHRAGVQRVENLQGTFQK